MWWRLCPHRKQQLCEMPVILLEMFRLKKLRKMYYHESPCPELMLRFLSKLIVNEILNSKKLWIRIKMYQLRHRLLILQFWKVSFTSSIFRCSECLNKYTMTSNFTCVQTQEQLDPKDTVAKAAHFICLHLILTLVLLDWKHRRPTYILNKIYFNGRNIRNLLGYRVYWGFL
jgi:hypothetical protein